MTDSKLSHINDAGHAQMVDVGGKPIVRRVATAEGFVVAEPSTIDRIMTGQLPKGEALSVARIAGISAAKRTDQLIPLCHGLPLDVVEVEFERADSNRLRVTAKAAVNARTGVEMEALTAVSVACLTIYDMVKAVDRQLLIDGIRLLSKQKASVRE